MVLVVGLGLWWAAREDARGASAEGVEADAEAAPAGSLAPAELVAVESAAEGEPREQRAPVEPEPASAEVAEPEPAAPAERDLVVFRARLVDERGSPLADGRLEHLIGKKRYEAASDAQGEVELAVDRPPTNEPRLSFVARAPGTVRKELHLARDLIATAREHFLGEIALQPGGSLAGRVVDERGAPVANAMVVARPPRGGDNPSERVFLPFSFFGDGLRGSAVSGEDGGYVLEGVPCVAAEVLASDRKHLVARSAPTSVSRGVETRVPDLVLLDPDPADVIRGIVLHEDGEAAAGVEVRLLSDDESGIFGTVPSGPDGRFEVVALQGSSYTLTARDAVTGRVEKALSVTCGDHEVVLRFGATREIEVVARDVDGPIESFNVVVEDAEKRAVTGHASVEPGLAQFPLPGETFHLNVFSKAHEPERLGPFEPASAPERLAVELEQVGGFVGTVRAGGEPVAGAEVHDHYESHRGDEPLDVGGGFFAWFEGSRLPSTRTDDDGRYFLPLRYQGRVRLHASAPGRGRALSAWHTYSEGARVELDLELPVPGAIEGRLLVAPGVDPQGAWIGASNGEAHVELVQCDEAGGFRFTDLAPGGWQVRRIEPGRERNFASGRLGGGPIRDREPPPWDVHVQAGVTTAFDLDVRDEVPCTLEGRLTLVGRPAAGTAVHMGRSVPLDGEGRFTLHAPKAGPQWIWLWVGDASLRLKLDLEAGLNVWERDLGLGTVLLENLPDVPDLEEDDVDHDPPGFLLEWRDGDTTWMRRLREAPSVRVEDVPAGALVLRWRAAGEDPDDPLSWPVLREIELQPGAVFVSED